MCFQIMSMGDPMYLLAPVENQETSKWGTKVDARDAGPAMHHVNYPRQWIMMGSRPCLMFSFIPWFSGIGGTVGKQYMHCAAQKGWFQVTGTSTNPQLLEASIHTISRGLRQLITFPDYFIPAGKVNKASAIALVQPKSSFRAHGAG